MNEVEVKVLEVSHKEYEEKLFALGAKKVADREIHDIYFSDPCAYMTQNNSILRIRKDDKKAILTYKKRQKVEDAKINHEVEVVVDSIEHIKEILLGMGYTIRREICKHRVTYAFEDAHIEFDTFVGENSYVPEFMEIEAESVAVVYKYADLLGISHDKCQPLTGGELLRLYKKE